MLGVYLYFEFISGCNPKYVKWVSNEVQNWIGFYVVYVLKYVKGL